MSLSMNGRDPLSRRAWRMAAIYRCCVRQDKDPEWALSKVREICPNGYRDHIVQNWFADMTNIKQHFHRTSSPQAHLSEESNIYQFAA